MADTVKKSRIVSESECLFADSLTEDSSLQDIINEEFNQRLKSCMTDAPIEPNAEHIALTYETGEIVLKNGDVTRVPITTSPDLTSGLNGNSNYNENGHQSYDQVDEAHYDLNQTQCSFKSDEFSLNTIQKTADHHQISDHHQIASDLSADSEHIESLSSQASSTPETQKERVFTTPQQQFECVVTTPDDQVTCISPDSRIFDCDPNLPQIEISESKDSDTTDLDIENEQIPTVPEQNQTNPDLITEQNENEANINTSGQISQNPQPKSELDQHQSDLVQVRTDPDPGSQNFELQSILNQNQIDLDTKQIDLDQNQIDLDHIQNHLDKNQIDLDQSQPNPNQQLDSPQSDALKSGLHTEFSDLSSPGQKLTEPALENEVIKSPDAEKSPETETSEQSYLNKEIPSPESDLESPFDNVTVTDVDNENLNAKERFLSMVADLDPSKSTSKDRMFLSTDSACILFTQTVVQSPMLTPTDENYDFLQGLRQTADATGTAENSEILPDAKPVIDCEDVSEISAENEVCRQIESSSSENDLSEAPKPLIPPPNPEAIQTITASFIAHESSAQLEFEPVCNTKEIPQTPSPSQTKKSESFGDIIENTPMKPEALLLKKSDWSPNKIDEISKIFSSVEKETVKSPSPLTETFENIQKTKEIFERLSLSPEHENYTPKSCDLGKKIEENSPSSEEFDVTNSFECREGLSTTITSESSFVETRTESNSGQEKILKKKKSKKSKKDNEKENISVCDINIDEENLSHVSVKNLCRSFSDLTSIESKTCDAKLKTRITYGRAKSMSDIRKDDINMRDKVFSNVSVKALRQCFDNLTNRNTNNCFEKNQLVNHLQPVKPSKKIQLLKSSFSKFDALQKKTVLQTRAADSGKPEKQNGATPQGDTSSCKTCAKQVFQMEQIKAEKCIWHKNCFRCQECNKQLTLDTYQSNDGDIYCKPHFKALFTPKAVEDDQPTRPRKHEMIIRENQPEELPPDVIRASDKPDLGLDELQNLNVKERFQVFEHHENVENSLERTPSAVNVKRSPSILSKLAKFQQRGMDIGVGDDSLNGVPVEESTSEEEHEEDDIVEGEDADLIRAKRAQREKPLHFNNMSDIMNKWETGNSMTKEERREERKQELQSIRNRIFMGKQGRMKEMYQQAVAESESGANVKKSILDTEHCEGAKSLKDKFEKGEALTNDEQEMVHELEEDKSVFESGISKKSRSIFLELDANASKAPQMTPVSPVKPGVEVRRAREAFMARQAAEDVVKASDQYEDVTVKTADITNRFKFFETFKEPEKQRKVFRITPPRDGQDKLSSPERDVYRDPEVVRGEEYVDDSEVVQKSHTATKMLSIFRQMEENLAKDPTPAGPKPLKRFTPPPGPTREESESGDEESDEEEEDEESDHEDKAKLVDDDLLEAQKAARAKQLRAKFEKWEANELQREQSSVNIAEEMTDGDSQIESAKSLRARFESMREVSSDKERAPRVKVNRFVDTTNNVEMCKSCEGRVYPLEKVSCHNNVYHKNCFRCRECNTVLRMDSFTYNQGLLYCVPHFKRLFIAKGNYESGFGLDQHKEKWNAVA